MNEQRHAWLVMKYQFSTGVKYRIPIYRIRREREFRNFYRMKLAGRATEKVFQFHRPFRGKAAFKMSAYHPRYGLVESSAVDVEKDAVCAEMIPATGSVRDLKGMAAKPEKAVSLDEMDRVT